MIGLEPTTYWLQINCSANWATSAHWITTAIQMATRMGFEPTTSAVTGRHSNQLNYRAILYQIKLHRLVNGGSNRARTCDPLLVRQMLSQLSYTSIWAILTELFIVLGLHPAVFRAVARLLHEPEGLAVGDPTGIRTRDTTVKGWCLNRLTIGPYIIIYMIDIYFNHFTNLT